MATEIEGFEQIEQPEQRARRKAMAAPGDPVTLKDKPAGLWPSLIAARAAIGAIPKSATNPHFGNKYAPLGAIIWEVVPKLAAHGLCLTATTVPGPALSVRIVSETGETASCDVPLVGMSDMQKVGGAFSYAYRYGVGALLALELEDDDDGNAASTPAPARQAAPQGKVSAARPTQGTPIRVNNSPQACPNCGVEGSIRQVKKGKNAGLWMCMPWEEKGRPGCWSKWNENPLEQGTNAAKLAAAQVDARIEDDPPPIGDDDLPF